jgi:hypothetical protein
MANTERELMKRGKPIEEIDHRVMDRVDAERDERLEAIKDELSADRPRRKPRGGTRRRA